MLKAKIKRERRRERKREAAKWFIRNEAKEERTTSSRKQKTERPPQTSSIIEVLHSSDTEPYSSDNMTSNRKKNKVREGRTKPRRIVYESDEDDDVGSGRQSAAVKPLSKTRHRLNFHP